ncbi:hypothetical protein D3C76_1139600 [compost metagenome]
MQRGGEFLNVHLDTAIPGHAHHGLIRQCQLNAQCRRQTEAHGSQATGVNPATRFIEWIIKGSKHLVLAHIGGDVSLSFGQPPDRFDHRLRFNVFTLGVVLQTLTGAPLLNLLPPVANIIQRLCRNVLRQQLQHLFQNLKGIAHNRHIGWNRFGNGSRVDIDMQHCRIRAVLRQIVGGAIVKTYADGENHIGVVHRHVGFISDMHA